MSIRKVALATVFTVAAVGIAFAQSSPAPANQSGPSVSPTTPSPTDPSAGAQSGNTKGTPQRGTMNKSDTMHKSGTTGAGSAKQQRMDKMDRDNTSVPGGQGVNKDDTTPKMPKR